MKAPTDFATEVEKLNKIIERTDAPIMERIRTLCELYRMYQGDVHMQAKTIRRIEDMIKNL